MSTYLYYKTVTSHNNWLGVSLVVVKDDCNENGIVMYVCGCMHACVRVCLSISLFLSLSHSL